MKACNQCGKCCKNYSDGGLSASPRDIEHWELFRPDILAYVSEATIWIDPHSGQQLARCPWLQREPNQAAYTCAIYDDRPEDCRHYPVTIEQMVMDDCEMLEVQDLGNTQQAQRDLDTIMVDSRPAVDRDNHT